MKVPRSPALSTYLLRQGSEGAPASSFTAERALAAAVRDRGDAEAGRGCDERLPFPWRLSSCGIDGVEAPIAGDALQLVRAAVFEGETRAGDEVSDGARDQHLAGFCVRRYPCARVHRDPCHLAVDQFALAGV